MRKGYVFPLGSFSFSYLYAFFLYLSGFQSYGYITQIIVVTPCSVVFFKNIFMLVGTLTLFPYFFSWPCLLALRISVKLLLLCYPLPTYPALSILTLFPSPLLSIRLSRIVMLYHFFHAAFEASCVGTLSPVFYKRAHPLCLFHIQQYPPLL